MAEESLRRARRRKKLEALLGEIGGPTQAELDTGTPRTHFVAMTKGRRGLGDDLAAKLERVYEKPAGWFDAPAATIWPFSLELQDQVLALPPEDLQYLEVAMWTHLKMKVPDDLHYDEEGRQPERRRTAPDLMDLGTSSPAQRKKAS